MKVNPGPYNTSIIRDPPDSQGPHPNFMGRTQAWLVGSQAVCGAPAPGLVKGPWLPCLLTTDWLHCLSRDLTSHH